MEEVISLTVVLPLLPAMPTNGAVNRARQPAAARDSAAWPSATSMSGSGRRGHGAIDHRSDGARRCGRVEELIAIEARAAQRQIDLARAAACACRC